MDRFIEHKHYSNNDNTKNLKSNMDRFIAFIPALSKASLPHLKSNMDRFIESLFENALIIF